jgi:hypothetical protein
MAGAGDSLARVLEHVTVVIDVHDVPAITWATRSVLPAADGGVSPLLSIDTPAPLTGK